MDALNKNTITAIEMVINCAEGVICHVEQDINKEILTITNDFGQKACMNCSTNSAGATLRQICKHINNKTLSRYEEDYTIGC